MAVLGVLLAIGTIWMHKTYCLIQLDQALQAANWDPYTELELDMPTVLSSGFNAPEVKKAYRGLAKKYHPDKVALLPEDEQEDGKNKWLGISKAYETLTDAKKFQNWQDFGNPDGPLSSRAFDVELALPSFLLDPKNQLYLLCAVFTGIVVVPLVVISRHQEVGEPDDPLAELDRWEYKQLRKKVELAEKKRQREVDDLAYQNDPDV